MAGRKNKRGSVGNAKAQRWAARKAKQAALRAGRDPYQGVWRLPLRGCFVNQGWREQHLASLMVARDRSDGLIVIAVALVDLGCLGVKDAWARRDMENDEYETALERMRAREDPYVPCDLELATAILRRGQEYAAELGFNPHREWDRVLQVIGPSSDDDQPPEIICGLDGKPYYVAGPDDDSADILQQLERHVGPDGFHFVAATGDLPMPGEGVRGVEALLEDLAATRAEDQDSLLLRCAKLKRCLILWSVSSELLDELRHFGRQARRGRDEEPDMDETIDRFIAAHRLEGGASIHEAFVARFPELGDDDRHIVLGWKDTVEGIFEIVRHGGDHLVLENLVDELRYVVRSNQGPTGLAKSPREGFLVGRICPLGDGWLMSGDHRAMPPSASDLLLASAADIAMNVPRLFFRNPDHLKRAWEQQRQMYEAFVEHFGSDEVIVPGAGLQAAMDGFMRHQVESARQRAEDEGNPLDPAMVSQAPVTVPLPPELLREPEVAVLDHPLWGQGFYLGYREVRRAFEKPGSFWHRRRIEPVQRYLEDEDLDPLPLLLLGDRFPEAASSIFATLQGRPGFDWSRDGEALLREHKANHYDRLLPRVVPLPERHVAAMRRTAEIRRG